MESADIKEGLKSSEMNHKRGVSRMMVLNVPTDMVARGEDFGPWN